MVTFLAWVILLAAALWWWSGWINIPVAWKGVRTLMGKRTGDYTDEGWRWAAWPWGLIPVNTEQQILRLGVIKALTSDNATVWVDSTIVYHISDPVKSMDVNKKKLKEGLDQKRTEVLRSKIRQLPMEVVFDIHEELGEEVKEAIEHKDWGVDILQVIVPEIAPDPSIAEDLAKKKKEELQRSGEEVEIDHTVKKMNQLMTPPPVGAGLTREQALEQLQLTTGKATKAIDAKTLTLDPVTAALVAKILEKR